MPSGWKKLLCIFLFALAVRGGFALTQGDELAWPDSRDYDSIARNMLRGEGFREAEGRQASRAPGYPFFLAACYLAGTATPRAIYSLQALAGAATCVLIVQLGWKLYGERVGLIAGWISVFYPFFVYFTGQLLAETLFMLGFVAYILLVAELEGSLAVTRTGRPPLTVATGALAGVLTLLRGSFLLFPIFLLPFWLARAERRLRVLTVWAIMTATMAVTMFPWVLRNYRLFGHFVPTTLQVGESLFEANSHYAERTRGGPAMHMIDWVKERGGVGMDEFENNEFFKKKAFRYIREHPGRFIVLALQKLRRFWNVLPNAEGFRSGRYMAISVCSYLPVLFFALLSLVGRRGQAGVLLLVMPPVLYYAVLHMVFVGSIRYRIPVMPFVILVAAAGAEALWNMLRRARPAGETVGNG